jgi:hypothetical protein
MNKKLIADLASIATELDVKGFTKEAKTMDNVLIKVAQMSNEGMSDQDMDEEDAKYYAEMAKAKQMIKDIIGDRYKGGSFFDTVESTMQIVLKVRDNLDNLEQNVSDTAYFPLNEFKYEVEALGEQLKDFVDVCERKSK